MHVVFIDLHAEDLRVALNVVPLGVGLERLLKDGVLQPCGELGGVDQVVDDALKHGGIQFEDVFLAVWPSSQHEPAPSAAVFPSPFHSLLFPPPRKTYLQVVGDEQLPEVVHLQHGGSIVLADAVSLQQVFGGHHLPGQPAQVESSIA